VNRTAKRRQRVLMPCDGAPKLPLVGPGKEDAAHFPLTENKKSQRNEMGQRNELRPLFRPEMFIFSAPGNTFSKVKEAIGLFNW